MSKDINQQEIFEKLLKYVSTLEYTDIINNDSPLSNVFEFKIKNSTITIKRDFDKNQHYYVIYIDNKIHNNVFSSSNLELLYDAVIKKSSFNNPLNNFYRNIENLEL